MQVKDLVNNSLILSPAKKSESLRRFDNTMAVAKKIAKENPDALFDLIKALLRPLQSSIIVDVVVQDKHKAWGMVESQNFFCNTKARKYFYDWDLENLASRSFKIRLETDIVFPGPWEKSRMVRSFSNIGEGRVWGKWKQDKFNHILTTWLPWRISFVGGGNHSIAAGIIGGKGNIVPNAVYDMSHVLKIINCDGEFYKLTNTGKKICKVRDYRIAAVFEIGRLINQSKTEVNKIS